ncbi:uncharacterized protein [Apostichopus japonicus]|uniref:uncharacterized protein isoform X1 n=1 Tax=Stichopus japonicus TaxID=307972 RepID=UPI003AB8B5AD
MVNFPCCQCQFTTQSFLKLLQHYRYMHKSPDSKITCNINSCHRTFSSTRSFQRHIRQKHSLFWAQYGRQRNDANINVNNDDEQIDDFEQEEHPNPVGQLNNPNLVAVESSTEEQVAAFLIGLRENFKVCHEACNFVATEMQNLLLEFSADMQMKVNSALQNENIDPTLMDHYNIFGESSLWRSLDHFSDARHVNSFCAQTLDFVEPVEYLLGVGANGKEKTFQYIDILETIKLLLKQDDIFAEVVNGHLSPDSSLQDYCDGALCKNNPLLAESQNIQIQLYHDDFCVANPLGNKVKNLKFSAFYFLIGNISPKLRSKLHVIQLSLLCQTECVKEFGLHKVLAPLVADLKKLERDGIIVEKDGAEHNIKGTLSMIVADNLAAHTVGGFQESFNTFRPCRFCLVTRGEIKEHMNANSVTKRTSASYDQQARMAENIPEIAGMYGLKKSSIFNVLQYFHVVNGLPSDIAHDLFEGIVPCVLEKVILHCVQENFFSLEQLNTEIDIFPYEGTDKVNKPTKMKTNVHRFKVKQNAIQTWCLLRLLPLMVGKHVPVGDNIWKLLQLIADVVELVVAPHTNVVLSEFLADLIESFLIYYFVLFPNDSMTPKFHYMIHYPHQMLQFGPLVHCWTLRFEGKHLYFKELSHRTKNRRNICKTLANRHEYYQSWFRTKRNFLSKGHVEHSFGNLYPIRLMLKSIQDVLLPVTGEAEMVYTAKKAECNGTSYWKGCAVTTDVGPEGLIKFGIVELICLIGGTVYFVCRQTTTSDYCNHLHAYVLNDTGQYSLRTTDSLLDHYPLSVYPCQGNEQSIVVIRHYILLP